MFDMLGILLHIGFIEMTTRICHMVLNLKPIKRNVTTYSHLPMGEQKQIALQTARDFYCHPERATSKLGEFNSNLVRNIAFGFMSWYGDEIAGMDIGASAFTPVLDAAKAAFDVFNTDRDAIATAVAFTALALVPPTQR